MQEEFLRVNVILGQGCLFDSPFVDVLLLLHCTQRFLTIQETVHDGEGAGSLPRITIVLQGSQKLTKIDFSFWSCASFFNEKADQVLIETQIGRICGSVGFWRVIYTMVVNLTQQLLEVEPGRKFQF